MTKDILKETVIKSETLKCEGAYYSYALIKRESTRVASYTLPLYSIEIAFTDIEGDTRTARAEDLFANYNKALKFYEKMVRNLATPIDLVYVVEDEMA